MSRDNRSFDAGEVAAVEARMFALLAADARDQEEDPPSAAHHQLFVWRDHQQLVGRTEAMTVMSRTLEAALAGRTDEVADRYQQALEWFDRDGGQYDHDLEQAVVQVGHRIHAAQAQERSPAGAPDRSADPAQAVDEPDVCPSCDGDGAIFVPQGREWHNQVDEAAMPGGLTIPPGGGRTPTTPGLCSMPNPTAPRRTSAPTVKAPDRPPLALPACHLATSTRRGRDCSPMRRPGTPSRCATQPTPRSSHWTRLIPVTARSVRIP